ncbi:hypothetical protein C5E06_18110 [Pseudoclavibacter sp. RFBI5]|uniref:ECF transporter S component n=1 Tax=Pseudoclavibacter sp. RFBI5 TaxID=2080578 RepID=UPI000CE7E758|nr:ECF transporter S component [Pseudoclavibacter sp. RFBI5]PPG00982.1 hypothetical protein C5E06_18110 [Pseudoclavibacter sp. RFBI5]
MRTVSTRLLMSCAAIGVAGGVVFTVNAYIGGAVSNLLPLVYGLTIGLYFIPGALAQALFRRPWVGLITSALAGLVASPFQPIAFGAFLIGVGIGVLQELPFLITRYRRWQAWLFLAGAAFAGLIMTAAAFRILGGGEYDVLGTVLLIGSFFISPPLCTMLAVWLAKQLERAGIGRDLRLAEDGRAAR